MNDKVVCRAAPGFAQVRLRGGVPDWTPGSSWRSVADRLLRALKTGRYSESDQNVLMLISAHIERVSVSCMQDFYCVKIIAMFST